MSETENIDLYVMATRLSVNSHYIGRIYREKYSELVALIPQIVIQEAPLYYYFFKVNIIFQVDDTIQENTFTTDEIDSEKKKMIDLKEKHLYNDLGFYIDAVIYNNNTIRNKIINFYTVEHTVYNKIAIGINGKYIDYDIYEQENLIHIDKENDDNKLYFIMLITGVEYDNLSYYENSNPYYKKDENTILYKTPDDFYNEKIEEAKAAIAIQILKEKAIELLKTITNNHAANCDAEQNIIKEKDDEIKQLKEQLNKNPTDNNLILSFNNNNSTDTQTNCENPEKDEQIKKLEQEIIQLKLQELKNVAIRALKKLLPDITCEAAIKHAEDEKDNTFKESLLNLVKSNHGDIDVITELLGILSNDDKNNIITEIKNKNKYDSGTIVNNNDNTDNNDICSVITNKLQIIINTIRDTSKKIESLTTIDDNQNKNEYLKNIINNDKSALLEFGKKLSSKDIDIHIDIDEIIEKSKQIQDLYYQINEELYKYNNENRTLIYKDLINQIRNNSDKNNVKNTEYITSLIEKFNNLERLENEKQKLEETIKKLDFSLNTERVDNDKKTSKIQELENEMNEKTKLIDAVNNTFYDKFIESINTMLLDNIAVDNDIKQNLNVNISKDILTEPLYKKYVDYKIKINNNLYKTDAPLITLTDSNINSINFVEDCNNLIINFFRSNFRYFLAFPLDYQKKNDRTVTHNTLKIWDKLFYTDEEKTQYIKDVKLHLIQFLFVDTYFEYWEKFHNNNKIYLKEIIDGYCQIYDINKVYKSYFNLFLNMLMGSDNDSNKKENLLIEKYEYSDNPNANNPIMHICDIIEMYNYYKYEYEYDYKNSNEKIKNDILDTIQIFLFNYYLKAITGKNYWLVNYCGITEDKLKHFLQPTNTNNSTTAITKIIDDDYIKELAEDMRKINTGYIMTIVKLNNYEHSETYNNADGKNETKENETEENETEENETKENETEHSISNYTTTQKHPNTCNNTYVPFIDISNNQYLNLIAFSKPLIGYDAIKEMQGVHTYYTNASATNTKNTNTVIDNNLIQQTKDYINVSLLNHDEKIKIFKFGGFTKVFFPAQPNNDNDEINDMVDDELTGQSIVDKIVSGKDVFIFGYGASGAGKTAMLVYNTAIGKNGFSLELCNEIAKKLLQTKKKENDTSGTSIHVQVKFKELYYNDKYNTNQNDSDDSKMYTYTYKDGQFKNENENENDSTNLSELLVKKITKERKISPTRNNPESSRSHILCFLQFLIGDVNSGSLIIADLAGVENVFDEKDSDTIYDMYNFYLKKYSVQDNQNVIFSDEMIHANNHELSISNDNDASEKNDVLNKDIILTGNTNTIQPLIRNTNLKIIKNGLKYVLPSKNPYSNVSNFNKIKDIYEPILIKKQQVDIIYYPHSFYDTYDIHDKNNINKINNDKINNDKINIFKYVFAKIYHEIIKNKNRSDKTRDIQKINNLDVFGYNFNVISANYATNHDLNNVGQDELKIHNSSKNNVNDNKKVNKFSHLITLECTNYDTEKKALNLNEYKNKLKNNNQNYNIEELYQKSETKTVEDFHNFIKDQNYFQDYNSEYIIQQEQIQKEKEKDKRSKTLFQKLLYVVEQIKIRKREGEYINNQLQNLRNEMLGCIVAKTKGTLFTSPIIHSSCLSSYCGYNEVKNDKQQLSNCFMIKKKPHSYENRSLIMESIVEYVKAKTNKQSITPITKNDLIETYKTLELVIFTVFNISKKQKSSYIPGSKNYFTEPTQYINIEPLKRYIDNYDDDGIINEIKKINYLFKYNEHKSVVDNLKKNDIIRTTANIIKKTNINKDDYKNIKEIIQYIDLHNAASPIGTLTFTDNMAKFGRDVICEDKCIENSQYEYAFKNQLDIGNIIGFDETNDEIGKITTCDISENATSNIIVGDMKNENKT
jgi:hypothetical protein